MEVLTEDEFLERRPSTIRGNYIIDLCGNKAIPFGNMIYHLSLTNSASVYMKNSGHAQVDVSLIHGGVVMIMLRVRLMKEHMMEYIIYICKLCNCYYFVKEYRMSRYDLRDVQRHNEIMYTYPTDRMTFEIHISRSLLRYLRSMVGRLRSRHNSIYINEINKDLTTVICQLGGDPDHPISTWFHGGESTSADRRALRTFLSAMIKKSMYVEELDIEPLMYVRQHDTIVQKFMKMISSYEGLHMLRWNCGIIPPWLVEPIQKADNIYSMDVNILDIDSVQPLRDIFSGSSSISCFSYAETDDETIYDDPELLINKKIWYIDKHLHYIRYDKFRPSRRSLLLCMLVGTMMEDVWMPRDLIELDMLPYIWHASM